MYDQILSENEELDPESPVKLWRNQTKHNEIKICPLFQKDLPIYAASLICVYFGSKQVSKL